MKIKLSSSNYDIIDHGSVILYQEDSELTFDIDAENGFAFQLILKFKNDSELQQCVNRMVANNIVTLECVNFMSSGTGTGIPVEVATIRNKKIYIAFWMYVEGDIVGQKKTKSVKYTLFMER